MHTLSLFPSLLTFGIFGPLVLRLVVSYFLINTGWNMYKGSGIKSLAIPHLLFGALLVLGIYTQAVVVLALLTIKIDWLTKRRISPISSEQMMLYWFAGVILLSLLVTGPGAIAVDYPL